MAAFLQAGVGIFLLVALVLNAGYDVVRGNAVKVFIVLALTIVALIVFQANGQVQWGVGLLLAVGNMIGAWLATRFAVEKGALWVRRFVIVVVLVQRSRTARRVRLGRHATRLISNPGLSSESNMGDRTWFRHRIFNDRLRS